MGNQIVGKPGSGAIRFAGFLILILLSFGVFVQKGLAQTSGEIRAGNDQVGTDDYFGSGLSLASTTSIGRYRHDVDLPVIDGSRAQAYYFDLTSRTLIKYDLKTSKMIASVSAPGGPWFIDSEAGYLYLSGQEFSTSPMKLHKYALGEANDAPREVSHMVIPPQFAGPSAIDYVALDSANHRAWFVFVGADSSIVQLNLGAGSTSPTIEGSLPIGAFDFDRVGKAIHYDAHQRRLYFTRKAGLYADARTWLQKFAVESGPTPLRLIGELAFDDADQPAYLMEIDAADGYGILNKAHSWISKIDLGGPEEIPSIVSSVKVHANAIWSSSLNEDTNTFYRGSNGPMLSRFRIHPGDAPPELTGTWTSDTGDGLVSLSLGAAPDVLYGSWLRSDALLTVGFNKFNLNLTDLKSRSLASTINVDAPMEVEAVRFYAKSAGNSISVALYTTGTHQVKIWSGARSGFGSNQWLEIPINAGTPDKLRLQPGKYILMWHSDTNGEIPAFSADADSDTIFYEYPGNLWPKIPQPNSPWERSPVQAVQRGSWSMYLTGKPGPMQSLLRVPAEFPTIQSAMVYAKQGDTIEVSPGTYRENVFFLGRDVNLKSRAPEDEIIVQGTIIDGGAVDSVVTFSGTESAACTLKGFTLRNGGRTEPDEPGGGIYGRGSKAHIHHNFILNNRGSGISSCFGLIEENTITGNAASYMGYYKPSPGFGGGLYNCDGTIRRNRISGNFAYSGGALAWCGGVITGNLIVANEAEFGTIAGAPGSPIIERNIISNNTGGGIVQVKNGVIGNNLIYQNDGAGLISCDAAILNNTIIDNIGDAEGTKVQVEFCHGRIENNIIWATNYTSPVVLNSTGPNYSCIANWTGGGVGNFSSDPRFVNPAAGDFRLSVRSPCLDRGKLIPEVTYDLDGRKRGADILHAQLGDGSHYDIGAYEAHLFTVSPNGGETWRIGQRAFVEWTANLDSVGSAVGLELWRDGVFAAYLGLDWNPNAQGRREIIVPNVKPGNDYQIRAISLWDGTYWDFSDGAITIVDDPNWRSAADDTWHLYR